VPCPRTQQANLPACSQHYPYNVEHQAGSCEYQLFSLLVRLYEEIESNYEVDDLTTRPLPAVITGNSLTRRQKVPSLSPGRDTLKKTMINYEENQAKQQIVVEDLIQATIWRVDILIRTFALQSKDLDSIFSSIHTIVTPKGYKKLILGLSCLTFIPFPCPFLVKPHPCLSG